MELKDRLQKHVVACSWALMLPAVVGMLAGCSGSSDRAGENEVVYATVNESPMTESDMKGLVPDEFYSQITMDQKKELVREWVDTELLYQEAMNRGIDEERDIARILRKTERDLLSSELLERELASIEVPDDETLREFYDSHTDYFILQTDEYDVRYAQFDTAEDAQDFWTQVKRGVGFSELAEETSTDESAQDGGALGVVNESMVEPAVWDAIVSTYEDPSLGLGKISSVFSVIDGWAIVIIDEVYKAGTLKPFEMVKDQVYNLYLIEKREETKQNLLNRLQRQADIEYNF